MKKVGVWISLIFVLLLLLLGVAFLLLYPVKYKDIVERYSQEFNLDKELVYGVINVESSFNEHALSKAGAIGLMQILPSTAREIAVKLKVENFTPKSLYNPDINIRFGCYYLRYLLDMFNGDLTKSLCAYNAGFSNVLSWINSNGVLEQIPFKETNNYVKKVSLNMKIYKNVY